jgi:hypothetical protein
MRKAKSFQKLRPDPPQEDPQVLRERRRSRGLSLGPLHFAIEGKGKEREPESPAKGFSRKSSFWRRRKDSLKILVHPEPQKPLPPVPNPPVDGEGHTHPQPPLPSTGTDDRNDVPGRCALKAVHTKRTPCFVAVRVSSNGATLNACRPGYGRLLRMAQSPSSKSSEMRVFPGDRPLQVPCLQAPDHRTSPLPLTFSSTPPQPLTDRADSLPLDPLKPRARASTNPPLFHRLSMNLFSSSPPIPALPHTQLTNSPDTSTISSPRPSTSKQSIDIPKPRIDEESPKQYVDRLTETVPKSDIATVLASR